MIPWKRLGSWTCLIASALGGCVTGPAPPPAPGSADRVAYDQAAEAVRRAVRYEHAGSVRAAGLQVLQRHFAEEALPWIRAKLQDDQPGVRFAALLAVGALGDRASLANVKRLANDADPNVRLAACQALHRLGDTSRSGLIAEALLDDASAPVRANAAFVLGQLGEPDAIKLLARAMRDPDDRVKQQALEAMARLGSADAVQELTFAVGSGPGPSQLAAVNALADLNATSLGKTFAYQLEHGEFVEVRLAAARALGRLKHPNGLGLALDALNFDDPRNEAGFDPPEVQISRVRTAAAAALGAIGDRRALAPLGKVLNESKDPHLQLAAADAILEILGGGRASARERPVALTGDGVSRGGGR